MELSTRKRKQDHSLSKLDMMDAKIRLNDYIANAPKTYWCEGVRMRKSITEKVDVTVKAHTAEAAKQKFNQYFSKDGWNALCDSCIRKESVIDKQGGIV